MRHTIWTIALALLTLGAWTAPAAAQERPERRGPDPEARMERLREKLDLTDAQADRVEAILADAMQQRRAIFEETREDREAVRERMRAVHESTRQRLGEILDEEQMQRLERMRPRGRRGGDGPRGRRPGAGRG